MTKYNIFIFRRDLRMLDNKGINYCINNLENVIPIFIFTPEQVTDNNKFKSNNAIQFMIESLKDLDIELKKYNSKLHLFYGENNKILEYILSTINADNVVFNMDYTPYALDRDENIIKICNKFNINCIKIQDYLLKDIGSMNKKDGDPYTVFTPFKNNGLKQKIDKPDYLKIKKFIINNSLKTVDYIDYKINSNILVNGGRKNGLVYLNNIINQKKYDDTRNCLNMNTTLLSSFIKFGCISIREVYWKIRSEFGKSSQLLAQIFWREFYYYIVYYYPHVLKCENWNEKYNNIKWKYNKNHFERWCNGSTGYPIIDAGMIELKTTGYMHNRARLITSNFLNRLLGINWKKGEKYYATQLTDYDPSVNNGNWQWIASTGVDPKPYFQRLFNPIIQSKKFDPDAIYIKKWLPNLKYIPANELHNWENNYMKYDLNKINYYKPIIDYKKAREESINMYRSILN